ncbi:rod shape-determining protein MreD [Salinibacillus xinjiangensis]|uniref:Rod shape-determining protein MreD n=1 Tax=Salinibacillus xinjiangensis TaxID=1229268 RepID=A0A6G1XBB3_9BACI|nr:rod shape-determining protein MreD [Salinibacillus xinjiangensis]MRG88222.1 rod shape-determining protein MreD [Salinibacillus xinjiangensis]
MTRIFPPLILLALLILESTATDQIPKQWLIGGMQPIPHWVLLFTVLIAIFYDQDNSIYSLVYAIIFGFLFDFTYTDTLGVYMFTYGLTIFIVLGFKQLLHPNFIVTFLLGFVAVFFADHLIYAMYYMIGFADISWSVYLKNRLIPTMLSNLLFLMIVYPMYRNRLEKWSFEHFTQK